MLYVNISHNIFCIMKTNGIFTISQVMEKVIAVTVFIHFQIRVSCFQLIQCHSYRVDTVNGNIDVRICFIQGIKLDFLDQTASHEFTFSAFIGQRQASVAHTVFLQENRRNPGSFRQFKNHGAEIVQFKALIC